MEKMALSARCIFGCQGKLSYLTGTSLTRKCNGRIGQTSYRYCSSRADPDGQNKALLDRIIRVDHAGEYGANRIYEGQMVVLGKTAVGPVIQEMWDQEKDHLQKFNELMVEHRVRPTILLPFWNVVGFALGAGTALLGKEGAMACTVAVEESISEHYNNQIRTLMEEDPEKYKELLEMIKKFRDEEMEHHDTGLEHDAELAPAYSVLKNTIQLGCKAAIYLSERV
ncbi:5-demethoxyubiquinone hydroxylase, mitochondrial [Latimeria chalumnae]|uniref:5-demethoxyubiquinone hydroxylase, mitochondrial n=1 Tax=Latimeria chalumnae TaxID=7897 RepID=H3A8N6_LATCH|nr:PREDICTED: 5-demethoxyubiquinone hydroxylase, mitochondrial [Latimeria chalumnae]|eukprot:XP_006006995.1 PREDICTED: 5-demethoxyubiquinone hydroxylase, mitochondrial [Latimeria chalumnae]